MKYFNKCRKLATIFREIFMTSVQYLPKIFRKTFRNLFRNDSGNISTTFLINFREIFSQCCTNIRREISRPSYAYVEKLCRKVSARFCVTFQVSSQEASLKYFNKCCSKLDSTFREIFVLSVQTIQKICR